MSVTFAKPPINEVVLGQVFLPRPDFLLPYFGVYWQQVRAEYPQCSHAAVVIRPGEEPVQDAHGNVLPRIWFRSADDTRLIQLQQDRLYVNWRQTEQDETYVRFPAIKAEFERQWGKFDEYVKRETGTELQPTRLELSYTNIIPKGAGWTTAAEYGNVIRDLAIRPTRYLLGPTRVSLNQEFDLPEDSGTLAVRLNTATRSRDKAEVLRLELAASGAVRQSQTRDEWIAIAHRAIVEGFKDLTTHKMHSDHWQLLDEGQDDGI